MTKPDEHPPSSTLSHQEQQRCIDPDDSSKPGGFPIRYFVAFLGAVGLLPAVGTRKVFALVMTHITSSEDLETSEELLFTNCTVFNTSRDTHVEMAGDTMFLLHSAYYAGSPILNIAGTFLATRVSPTLVITSFVMTSGLITMCLPFVITASTPLLFVLRLFQGAIDGIQQPCTTGVLSAWTTDMDKARLFMIYFTGAYLAPAVAALLSAATMCYVSWSSSLFISGGLGVVWSVVWAVMIYDTPEAHPSLSREQRDFHRKHGADVQLSSKKMQHSIPWRHIVTSPPVWSVFTGFFCHCYIYSMLVAQQPQYFFDSFKINISDIGMLTTLPHIGLSISCIFGGVISDRLLKFGLSITFTRKLLFSIGKLTEGMCLIGLFFTHDWRVAITLITVGVTIGGLAEAGYHPLPADLAPQFAGVIAGFVSMGAIGAFFSTLIASFMSGKSKTIGDWQKMFLVSGLVDIMAVVLFDVMANAELQPWALGSYNPLEKTTSTDNLIPDSDKKNPPRISISRLLEKIGWNHDKEVLLMRSQCSGGDRNCVLTYGTCTPSHSMIAEEKEK